MNRFLLKGGARIYEKIFFSLFIYLYIFLLLGLVLHTSQHPHVWKRYTVPYFILLGILAAFFWPYKKFLEFSLRSSIITIRKKKIALSPLRKFMLYLFVFFFLILLPLEIFLRYKNIQYHETPVPLELENFQPFLQAQNVQSDNRKFKDLHLNSFGFRGEEIQKKKPAGVYRIFILGNSTVLNKEVPYEENSARVLEKMLNNYYKNKKIEVLNAGASGYTSEHSLIQYLFKIKDFDPDMIIMWQGITDMNNSCSPAWDSLGPYQPDYSNKVRVLSDIFFSYYKPKPIVDVISFQFAAHFLISSLYSDIINHFRITDTSLIKSTDKPVPMTFQSIDAFKRNIDTLIKVTKADGVKLILGSQPYLYNKNVFSSTVLYCKKGNTYPDVASEIKGIETFNTTTDRLAQKNEVSFVDIAALIPKTKEYFFDDTHFNAKANHIVAQAFFQFIVTHSVLER